MSHTAIIKRPTKSHHSTMSDFSQIFNLSESIVSRGNEIIIIMKY